MIVFSAIGYNTQEVKIGARSTIDIVMKVNVEELQEVIVIGYGTVEKGDVTGVVTQVSAEKFNKGLIVSPDQLLSGKVAGVNISNSGGTPGGGFNINIRGATSLLASSQPLIVIDGVPIDMSGMPGGRSALNFLNPS
jgi:iron complex outermembrane receptor protein